MKLGMATYMISIAHNNYIMAVSNYCNICFFGHTVAENLVHTISMTT